jgi:hypothetical protein
VAKVPESIANEPAGSGTFSEERRRAMTRSTGSQVIGALIAMLASAVFIVMYVANGIVYGSLVGLKNREHDLQVASIRGKTALALAVSIQVVAMVTTAFALSRQNLQARARIIIGGIVSILGTAVIFVLLLQIIRVFKI